jgi:hypothetical protein
MGLFSRNSETRAAETSYSREWLSRTHGRPRKLELAVAVIARMAQGSLGNASAWGEGLDDGGLKAAVELLDDAIQQDRSLVGHVARDLVLFFEANGGIAVNQGASLESVGLAPSSAFEDEPGSPSEHAAMEATAVARAIKSRREGGEASPSDLAVYRALSRTDPASAINGRSGSVHGPGLSWGDWRLPIDCRTGLSFSSPEWTTSSRWSKRGGFRTR